MPKANYLSIQFPTVFWKREERTANFHFSAAVAGFGMLLRNSSFVNPSFAYSDVIALGRKGLGKDVNGHRKEFLRLVEKVKGWF